ncbi:MAG: EF-hand domain-containing protein [Paracoccaceae bacterium]
MLSIKSLAVTAALALAGTTALAQQGGGMAHFMEEWDMNRDGQVTADDIAARRVDLFAMFDLNGDNTIDAEEQANMASTIAGQEENNREGHGTNGPGPRIHAAMVPAYNDANGDGNVTAEEFAAASPRLFAELDSNGDGMLNRADFGH